MLNKHLIRGVALSVAVCLIADPVTASVFQPEPAAVRQTSIMLEGLYSQQAVVAWFASARFLSVRVRLHPLFENLRAFGSSDRRPSQQYGQGRGRTHSYWAVGLTALGLLPLVPGQNPGVSPGSVSSWIFSFMPVLFGLGTAITAHAVLRVELALRELQLPPDLPVLSALRHQWKIWILDWTMGAFSVGMGLSALVTHVFSHQSFGWVGLDACITAYGAISIYRVFRKLTSPTRVYVDPQMPAHNRFSRNIARLSPAQVFDNRQYSDPGPGEHTHVYKIGYGNRFNLIDPGWGRWWFVADPKPLRKFFFWGEIIALVQDIFEFDGNGEIKSIVRLYEGDVPSMMQQIDLRLNLFHNRGHLHQLKLIVPAATVIENLQLRVGMWHVRLIGSKLVDGAPEYRFLDLETEEANGESRNSPNTSSVQRDFTRPSHQPPFLRQQWVARAA